MTDMIEQQAAPQAPQPMTNEQRVEAIKTFLFQNVMKKYQDLSGDVNNLCIDQNLKRIIIEKLDDAWLWVKEAFNVLQVQFPEEPKAPVEQKKKKHKKRKK